MVAPLSVVMLGASGAVGGEVVAALCAMPALQRLTLLGRRPVAQASGAAVSQPMVDALDPASYRPFLGGHDAAVCTFGVSQPSQMSRQEFVRIDRDAVLAFARACKEAGVRHFELLGSAAADSASSSSYLRTKGELRDGLESLHFERTSIFQPSMILTPTNRFGLSQALTLALWPRLSPLLIGRWRKFRGIRVETLGRAMALNLLTAGRGVETLHWDEFLALTGAKA